MLQNFPENLQYFSSSPVAAAAGQVRQVRHSLRISLLINFQQTYIVIVIYVAHTFKALKR